MRGLGTGVQSTPDSRQHTAKILSGADLLRLFWEQVDGDAYCTKCKKKFSGEVCPVCGEKEAIQLSAPLLHTFIGFMAVGLVTIVAFAKIYRPVDSTGVSKTGRRHSTQRRGETYQIEIEAESLGKKKHLLDVNRDLYCVLNTGDAVLVEIHSGALGLSWYGQIRATK